MCCFYSFAYGSVTPYRLSLKIFFVRSHDLTGLKQKILAEFSQIFSHHEKTLEVTSFHSSPLGCLSPMLCLIKITFLSHPIGEVVALSFGQIAETSFQILYLFLSPLISTRIELSLKFTIA